MNESNLPSPESTPPSAGYNLQQNLVYMFKDANWLSKILVGALVSLVPILNFASYGYAVQTTRNIRDDEATPLPGWSGSIGKFFGEGLKLFVIGLLYSIPLWILSLILIPIFTSDSGAADALGVLIALVELVVALLLIFWFQGVIVNFANVGTIGSGFQLGKIWASSAEHGAHAGHGRRGFPCGHPGVDRQRHPGDHPMHRLDRGLAGLLRRHVLHPACLCLQLRPHRQVKLSFHISEVDLCLLANG